MPPTASFAKSACFSQLISAGVHFPARVRNTACFFYQLLLRLLCYRGGVSRMAEAPAGLIPPKFNIDQPRFELISKNLDVINVMSVETYMIQGTS